MGLPEAIPIIERAIEKGVFPGAAFALGKGNRFQTAFRGRFEYCPESPTVDADTLWDLASLSKVVGTTSVAMRRFEEKRLDLSAPVSMYLPEFGQNGKERVTIRQLLLHEAGLIPFRPYETFVEPQAVRAAVWAEKLQYPPGTKSMYSDLSMIALQAVLEKVTGETLDRQVELVVGIPGLTYRPDEERCSPTELVEPWRRDLRLRRGRLFANGTYIQGEVHDPTACVLGGVAGHAGLFAPLEALTTFCTRLLTGGIAKPATVERFTRAQSKVSTRALGWDTGLKWAGAKQGARAFGHTGYTGTSIWIDPDRRQWILLLTNRVHPTAANRKLIAFRKVFHEAMRS